MTDAPRGIPDARQRAKELLALLRLGSIDITAPNTAVEVLAAMLAESERETMSGLAAEARRRGNPLVQFNDEADHTITLVQLRVSEWLEQEARKIK